jgi:hypothetical protein
MAGAETTRVFNQANQSINQSIPNPYSYLVFGDGFRHADARYCLSYYTNTFISPFWCE